MTLEHQPPSTPGDPGPGIDRREAIRRVSALLGGIALAASSGVLVACDRAARSAASASGAGSFTPADIAFLDEVADTILPPTDSPGAKAAQCGAFMALMVTDTYDPGDQQAFRAGMGTLEAQCRQAHGAGFLEATPAQRLSLLETLDREQLASRDAPGAAALPRHYFRMMKELALVGYFTSEFGCTQALRYAETPGRYDPCVPYAPGERSWAGHA